VGEIVGAMDGTSSPLTGSLEGVSDREKDTLHIERKFQW
jgi:hypothetical protein